MPSYPKRLIEVDLPIKKISEHARREKSIRHGHISTLHIWWARRPLAACRAVICAALWPDPGDPNCPERFKTEAASLMKAFRDKRGGKPYEWEDGVELRKALLDFIADFANWDNAINKDFLETSRALTQVAHESLGGEPGTRPLVVDPFAGGGSIPLEALRVGADAFASDLNPVAVLLNKVVLEYIPKYGQKLADEVRKWGEWIKKEAEKELAEFYPKDPDGATPIAYLWARTIKCEGPGCGAEVPLIRSLWLAKKANRSIALRIVVNKNLGADQCGRPDGGVVGASLAGDHSSEDRAGTRPAPTIDFEINENIKVKDVGEGTVRRGAATCPCCGYTIANDRVRLQLSKRLGGASDARLIAVVTTRTAKAGRYYRLPNQRDIDAIREARDKLHQKQAQMNTSFCLVPDELIPLERPSPNARGLSAVTRMGVKTFGNLFLPRQALALTTLVNLVADASALMKKELSDEMTKAIQTCLALVVDKAIQYNSSLCRWKATGENLVDTFARQALPIVWDFVEAEPNGGASGDFMSQVEWHSKALSEFAIHTNNAGHIECANATAHPLPNRHIHLTQLAPIDCGLTIVS